MARSRKEDAKSKGDRLQAILRLVQEYPISRQEVLLDYLRKEGFEVTQATISRDIRELCLVKAATAEGYRYVSSRSEGFNPKTQSRFETIFHESVLGVDYAGHVVLVSVNPERKVVRMSKELVESCEQFFWSPEDEK